MIEKWRFVWCVWTKNVAINIDQTIIAGRVATWWVLLAHVKSRDGLLLKCEDDQIFVETFVDVVVVWPSLVPRARPLPSGTGNEDLSECFSSTFYWPGVLTKNRACVPLPLDKDNQSSGNEIGFGSTMLHPGTRTSSIVAPINVAIGWTCVKTSSSFLLWLR